LAELCNPDCCVRIRAARRLGRRWNADFCCDCDVLPGLVQALLGDPCWEVRRAAAWSLALQGARTELGLAALYVSSRLDRHYLVRDKAAEALDILTLCRKECYKELFRATDALVKQLTVEQVRPGRDQVSLILGGLMALPAGAVPAGREVMLPPAQRERMPPPQPPGQRRTPPAPR
jgi:hypothetical protein